MPPLPLYLEAFPCGPPGQKLRQPDEARIGCPAGREAEVRTRRRPGNERRIALARRHGRSVLGFWQGHSHKHQIQNTRKQWKS